MATDSLPPCGLYRTTVALEDVPAHALVYFHNHGDPGPGVYLPSRWQHNRAEFHAHGRTLPEPYAKWAATLEPLPPEGFYRVREAFHCCEKKCRTFEPELLVQLGYDGDARPIVFVPELGASGLALPESGSVVDRPVLAKLSPVKVATGPAAKQADPTRPPGLLVH